MIDAGWIPIEGEVEVPVAGITGAGFEKGDEILIIQVIQAGDQVTVTVIVGPKDIEDAPVEEVVVEEEVVEEGPPTSDVAGEDKKDVPRYPGSVRTGSVSVAGIDFVDYVTSASIDEVLAFYEKELPANGWTEITPRLQVDGATFIGAIKGNRTLMVQCSRSENYSDWGPNYTSVFLEVANHGE
ncbi:MAG: hypothetical protein IBV53_05155 [Candidatus Atribacteria bacterium]